jgi:hypothetical protein
VTVESWDLARLADEAQARNGLTPLQFNQHWLAKGDRWLARGDCWLIYENVDLGDANVGLLVGCSWGSDEAQLPESLFPEPPDRMPDFDGQPPGWRYRLKAEVRPA